MIVAGNLKSFIGASHFLPEEMELRRRRILSPNSHIGRERSVCISALTESSEHLQAPARSKGMWPGVSSHQYWKNTIHFNPNSCELWRCGLNIEK